MKQFFKNRNVAAPEWIALSDSGSATVVRDGDGVPTAWRILPVGRIAITKLGEATSLEFSSDDIGEMVASWSGKGYEIPIDCDHFSKHLSDMLSQASGQAVEEPELAAVLKGEKAAAGFCSLEQRQDGLWAVGVRWVPRARTLMKEKMYKWFSPVIRGLSGATPLRVTSLALTNTPAIDQLDSLVASAEDANPNPPQGEGRKQEMDLLKKLKALLAMPETATEEQVVAAISAMAGKGDSMACSELCILLGIDAKSNGDAIKAAIKAAKEKPSDTIACSELAGVLGISSNTGAETIKAALKALKDKSGTDTVALSELNGRVLAMEKAAKQDRIDRLVAEGTAQGKISQAMLPWAKKQDEAVLSEFLASAPVVVPVGAKPAVVTTGDAAVLTAEDKDVCAALGIDEKAFLEQKKK